MPGGSWAGHLGCRPHRGRYGSSRLDSGDGSQQESEAVLVLCPA